MLSLGPLFNLYVFAFITYCFAYFASQTSGLCNAFPSVPFEVCALMFVILLCALRLTNIGFVQCLHVGSLWNFARVCFYVLRASPRKNRVCAVLFRRPLLSLYACVSHVLPYKHRVCAVLFSRFPFKKFVRLCFSRFVMRIFPHKHRVCAVPFPRPPVKFVRLSLSCYVMRTSPQEHQFRATRVQNVCACARSLFSK